MIYTPIDISRISGSRLAIKGQFYLDTKGNKYKGTAEGRLEQVYTIDKTIAVKLEVDDAAVPLNDYLKGIKSNLTSIETNIDTIEISIDNIKKDFTNVFLLMGA